MKIDQKKKFPLSFGFFIVEENCVLLYPFYCTYACQLGLQTTIFNKLSDACLEPDP